MSIAQEITAYIVDQVARANTQGFYREPLVGFSSAADPLYEQMIAKDGPPHIRPRDVLPEVKTLVSFFIPFSEKVVKANRVDPVTPAREWVDSYAAANILLDKISLDLVALMEAKGLKAASMVGVNSYNQETLRAPWSHRTAAFVAGLGRFGRNNLLLTRVGGAGRYGTVFLAEELPPTSRSDEEYCLFLTKGKCDYCLTHCPAGALGPGMAEFDRFKCDGRLREVTDYAKSLGWVEDVCGKCDVGPCAIF